MMCWTVITGLGFSVTKKKIHKVEKILKMTIIWDVANDVVLTIVYAWLDLVYQTEFQFDPVDAIETYYTKNKTVKLIKIRLVNH